VGSFPTGSDFAVRSPAEPAPVLPSACPGCKSSSISTTAKSPDANSYWRCGTCGEIWNAARRQGMRSGALAWR
jgi:predicted Zn finger-like uncharacterized protein